MLIYWSMFIAPAILATREAFALRTRMSFGALAIILAVWVIMAFRETGGDYPTYLRMFELADGQALFDTIAMGDPGYMFLNWVSSSLGFGIYGVNAACAIIFLTGLYRFLRDEPKPLLALTIAMTYLVIVVAMGYTRQGTAIGLLLMAIREVRRYRPLRAASYIAAAAMFHSSAAIAFPLLYFAIVTRTRTSRNIVRVATAIAGGYALYLLFNSQAETFYKVYVVGDNYSSDGAVLRSLSNAAAGVVLLLYWKKWGELFDDRRIWVGFAVLSLLSVPGAFVASTAVDRMGLYLIPLQLVAFGRLPVLAAFDKRIVAFGVLAVYTMSFAIWLHFGQFAGLLWLPYKSVVFGVIS